MTNKYMITVICLLADYDSSVIIRECKPFKPLRPLHQQSWYVLMFSLKLCH